MLRPIQTGFRRQIPVIFQTETAECGLACLAMILCAHGHLIDLASLRRESAVSGSGLNLRSLMRIADRFGLNARPVKLDLPALGKLSLPCILHWDFNHFVVLVKISEKEALVHDPARGARKLRMEEVSRHFTGVAVELTPVAKFEKCDDRRFLSVGDMFRHITGLKGALLVLGSLSLGLELIALVNPILSQVIIDEVLTTGDRSLLWTIAVGLVLLVVSRGVIATFRTWTVMLLSTRISVQWNVSLFTHLMGLPQDFFAKRGAGDILSRFGSLGTIQQTFTTDLIQSVMDGLMAIGMFAMIVIYGKWLTSIVVISSLLDLILRIVLFGPYREMSEEMLVHGAQQQGHFLETLRGMRSIKLLSLEHRREIAWANRLINRINAGLSIQRYDLIFARAQEALFGIDRVLMLVLGARMVLSADMSVGMLIAFLSYRDQFASRFGSLVTAGFKIRNLKVQCDRLSDIALAEAEISENFAPRMVMDLSDLNTGKMDVPIIECRNIGYRYGKEDAWVFRNVNLTVSARESLAITGPSGCGKSTLLAIVMGLIQPEEGQVLWNGAELTPANRAEYRSHIAGVLQDDILLSGSIAENIASFDEAMDLAWVAECAKSAQIFEDIRHMPMGFETLVGEMGSTLSGGQRQRLILARALYRKPTILFLDEATSNLDFISERAVETVLDALTITRIIVTHRVETVNRTAKRFEM
ncbi:peptidase domain-containing ABC transporter [Gluconacetobacter diazotrophicus]|uniref:Peptidase domain-containing ABC transporter n=1 Tax=Gluconacetobacter diazotrophicus TaxID=33996 RepID=A0A7W4I8E2_GLUDI|nr:peptidase domain-containing ABC transporter [Gluconacetobacter diazotrophicus]MBB2158131.1 peptidase domain-containing ABC transporter [Gluconacetobacter diazotrophicus]